MSDEDGKKNHLWLRNANAVELYCGESPRNSSAPYPNEANEIKINIRTAKNWQMFTKYFVASLLGNNVVPKQKLNINVQNGSLENSSIYELNLKNWQICILFSYSEGFKKSSVNT